MGCGVRASALGCALPEQDYKLADRSFRPGRAPDGAWHGGTPTPKMDAFWPCSWPPGFGAARAALVPWDRRRPRILLPLRVLARAWARVPSGLARAGLGASSSVG